MARYKGRPERYQPGLEYYLRRKPEGGDLREPGEMRPPGSDRDARRECLVLVHGYNNHEGEAAEAYLGFRDRQYAHFGNLQPQSLETLFGDAFWPGDADWAGPIDWVDFLFYPVAVGVAKAAAPKLADLIGKRPRSNKWISSATRWAAGWCWKRRPNCMPAAGHASDESA